jgi:hypothetical protein
MKNIYQKLGLYFVLFMLAMGSAQLSMAQGNSANAPGKSSEAPGKNKNLGHGNASNGIKAVIQANRQIFYTGDLVDIGVRFPRGSQLIRNGDVDAWLMIFDPEAILVAVPISAEASTQTTNMFRIEEVDVDFLPEGVYQLGVVVTVPDGDPMNMSDWYNGMLGLLTVRGLTVSAEALEIDDDGDGFVDTDTTGDGFVDDDDDEDDDDDDTDDSAN